MPDVECIVEANNTLGEGVIWNPPEKALYWVDSQGEPRIQRYDPVTGAVAEWPMPADIGSMVFREQGGIAAGLRTGFHFVDLEAGTVNLIVDPEPGEPENRLNDGKCDRRGRYWCGSLDERRDGKGAALYRLDPDLTCTRMETGISTSNRIAWSPDDKTMYYACSRSNTCWAYDYDIAEGRIENRRVFIDTSDSPAWVDGATVDADGCYWCAHIWNWEIARYDPDGRLMETIRLPVEHPTMCTFGGENLDVLYVTSTRKFLKPEAAAEQPLAGGLFAVHGTGATGLPEPFFAG